jgi:3',5'-cyclic AMP phosphodiesterase CpdA
MKNDYKFRMSLLFVLLPVILLTLVVLSFLLYSFFDRPSIKTVSQKQIVINSDGAVKFLVFGDSGSSSKQQKDLVPLMMKEDADLILHTGDLAYDRGSIKEIKEKVLDIYEELFAQTAFYPSLGNHDYLTDNGQPFIDTFELPENERYYSLSVGKILFIAIDSNVPLNELRNQMLPWLEKTLAEKGKQNDWIIAYFHHPAYSSGSHGSEKRVQDKLVPILEKYSVDLVFNGHDHNYQRTCRILVNSCDENGIVYIVTGGGGRDLYPVGKPQWFTEFQDSLYHFVLGEKQGCNLTIKAINLIGQIFDEAHINKC